MTGAVYLAILLTLLLAGCATRAQIGREGPVTVILDDARTVAATCATITRQPSAWGCVATIGEYHFIFCPRTGGGTAQCLAHEVRHVIEPTWRHER